jgi:hypothetical protein
MTAPHDGSPTPIHRALDSLTAAIIELQQLRRRLAGEQPPEGTEIDQSLESLEERLHELAATLTALRADATDVERGAF